MMRGGWVPREADEQAALFRWAEYNAHRFPELRLMFHVPNGGSRNAREAHNLRLQGVKAGVPDIVLPVPRGKFGGLYIEMKRRKNGRLSDHQKTWLDALAEAGNKAVRCDGWEQAKDEILLYLGYIRVIMGDEE